MRLKESELDRTIRLSHDLAHLVHLLTLRVFGGARPDVDLELREAVDRFVGEFEVHLQEQDKEYLPELKALGRPDINREVEHFRHEHYQLRAFASKMRNAIHKGRPREARKWARRFLCSLLRHTLCQRKVADELAEAGHPAKNP